MQKDFIFQFFQDLQKQRNELEMYIHEDNKLKIDIIILRLKKMLDKLQKNLDDSFRAMIQGEG